MAPVREGEGDARDPEEHEAADDGVLRAEARGREPAGDASEESAGAEGGEEQAGTGLREVELVGVVGDERRQRGEEQCVDEDDRADEGDEPAHGSQDMQRPAAVRHGRPQKCTEPVTPSSGNPTDLRRSECHSESHQPRTLRTRCRHETKRRERAGQAPLRRNFAAICGTTVADRVRPEVQQPAADRSTWARPISDPRPGRNGRRQVCTRARRSLHRRRAIRAGGAAGPKEMHRAGDAFVRLPD